MWFFGKKVKVVNVLEVEFKYALGATVKDKISGLEGVVVSRTQWLNACNVYGIQARDLGENGKIKAREHFDEPQLDIVEGFVAMVPTRETGGPATSTPMSNR